MQLIALSMMDFSRAAKPAQMIEWSIIRAIQAMLNPIRNLAERAGLPTSGQTRFSNWEVEVNRILWPSG